MILENFSSKYKIGEFEVNRIGLGTMRLTSGEGKWGYPKDELNAVKVLQHAANIGVNFFDTADMYGPEISENIIAKALFPYNSDMIIATKGGNDIYGPNNVKPNCSPENLRNKLHESLKRLKLERIDLYQLHTVDPKVEIEYSIEALEKLKLEGKIRYIGVSNIDLENLERALKISDIKSVQNRFNFEDRSSENIISFSQNLNIAFISYYPLQKGNFKKYRGNSSSNTFKKISSAQETLLWQLKNYSNLIAIPGTTSIKHLNENFDTLKYLKNERFKNIK